MGLALGSIELHFSLKRKSPYAETAFFLSTLSGLVEFDGYYLESDPCLVCNNPEVPFCVSDASTLDSPEPCRASGFLFLELDCASSNGWSPGA